MKLDKNQNKRFDLVWGIAPKGTPKHKAGEKAKTILAQELALQRKEWEKEIKNVAEESYKNGAYYTKKEWVEKVEEIKAVADNETIVETREFIDQLLEEA